MTPSAPPGILLAIETAGSGCSAAVLRDGAVAASECRAMRYGHAEALLPIIDRVMRSADLPPSQIEIVAAAVGPGGFTGIRVGLAAAHGIALAAGARLVGVSNFAAVAAQCRDIEPGAALLVALDSRREDLYVQLFAGAEAVAEPASVMPEDLAEYGRAAEVGHLMIAGDAAEAAAASLAGHFDVTVVRGSQPTALGVAAAALTRARRGDLPGPVRPLYLRAPDVTLPRRR